MLGGQRAGQLGESCYCYRHGGGGRWKDAGFGVRAVGSSLDSAAWSLGVRGHVT